MRAVPVTGCRTRAEIPPLSLARHSPPATPRHSPLPQGLRDIIRPACDCGVIPLRLNSAVPAERWPRGLRRRFAKPLYGLKLVPGVRIHHSTPDFFVVGGLPIGPASGEKKQRPS